MNKDRLLQKVISHVIFSAISLVSHSLLCKFRSKTHRLNETCDSAAEKCKLPVPLQIIIEWAFGEPRCEGFLLSKQW